MIYYSMVHYHYHGQDEAGQEADHFREGHNLNIIGIPNKKHTQGRGIFMKVKDEDVMHVVLYDADSKKVCGTFTSNGGRHFIDEENIWSPDGRVTDETWPLRLEGETLLDWDRAITVDQIRPFLPKNRAPRRGSVEYISPELYHFVKRTMRKRDA